MLFRSKGLVKSLIEAAMNAELDHHLGYEKHERRPPCADDARNGNSTKKLKGYPIVYFDAIVLKVHDNKRIVDKAVCLALGVNTRSHKELFGHVGNMQISSHPAQALIRLDNIPGLDYKKYKGKFCN